MVTIDHTLFLSVPAGRDINIHLSYPYGVKNQKTPITTILRPYGTNGWKLV